MMRSRGGERAKGEVREGQNCLRHAGVLHSLITGKGIRKQEETIGYSSHNKALEPSEAAVLKAAEERFFRCPDLS